MTKILIIDDDPDIIDSLSLILESKGYEVIAKTDSDGVMEAVKAANPDLIILDIMFPEDPQFGFQAARELSREPKVSEIPVLLLSAVNQRSNMSFGFSDSDISQDFMPVGAFIEKPVEPQVLVDKIEALLKPVTTH